MITSILMGGQGNQMFEFAHGLAHARRLGVDLQLDVSLLGGKRKYVLDQWAVRNPTVTGVSPTIFENGMAYNQDLDQRVKDGDCLQGYFQSERYFKHIEEHLRMVFIPRTLDIESGRIIEDAVAERNSVAVHIRRDDYLLPPHKDFHGELPFSYYESAKKYIQQRVESPKFFIFCEDVNWARTYFNGDDTTVVEPGQEAQDITAMSWCKHAIIANSSFSWWGAWLGDFYKNRIVVAPDKWFQDPHADYKDIVPERWIRI